MKLTVLTESNQQLTASIEAWLLAIYKTLTPAQQSQVLAEVEKIDREAIRLNVPRHQTIAGAGGIALPPIPAARPLNGRTT